MARFKARWSLLVGMHDRQTGNGVWFMETNDERTRPCSKAYDESFAP